MANSPFDTHDEPDEPVPQRVRRPWWRWNVITLGVALFLLVWLRELLRWQSGAVWLSVFTVAIVWLVAPLFFVPSRLTTIAAHSTGAASTVRQTNRLVIALKVASVFLMVISCVQLLMTMWALSQVLEEFTRRGGMNWMNGSLSILSIAASPIMNLATSGCLFCLAEIVLRLTPTLPPLETGQSSMGPIELPMGEP